MTRPMTTAERKAQEHNLAARVERVRTYCHVMRGADAPDAARIIIDGVLSLLDGAEVGS